ncbi:MAG: hypothetical protein AAFZ18_09275 [Myxococcota bacterium]
MKRAADLLRFEILGPLAEQVDWTTAQLEAALDRILAVETVDDLFDI